MPISYFCYTLMLFWLVEPLAAEDIHAGSLNAPPHTAGHHSRSDCLVFHSTADLVHTKSVDDIDLSRGAVVDAARAHILREWAVGSGLQPYEDLEWRHVATEELRILQTRHTDARTDKECKHVAGNDICIMCNYGKGNVQQHLLGLRGNPSRKLGPAEETTPTQADSAATSGISTTITIIAPIFIISIAALSVTLFCRCRRRSRNAVVPVMPSPAPAFASVPHQDGQTFIEIASRLEAQVHQRTLHYATHELANPTHKISMAAQALSEQLTAIFNSMQQQQPATVTTARTHSSLRLQSLSPLSRHEPSGSKMSMSDATGGHIEGIVLAWNFVREIQRATTQLNRLMEDLRTTEASVLAGHMQVMKYNVRLSSLLRDVRHQLQSMFAIKVVCEIDAALPKKIVSDPLRLRQLLVHGIANVVRRHLESGSIAKPGLVITVASPDLEAHSPSADVCSELPRLRLPPQESFDTDHLMPLPNEVSNNRFFAHYQAISQSLGPAVGLLPSARVDGMPLGTTTLSEMGTPVSSVRSGTARTEGSNLTARSVHSGRSSSKLRSHPKMGPSASFQSMSDHKVYMHSFMPASFTEHTAAMDHMSSATDDDGVMIPVDSAELPQTTSHDRFPFNLLVTARICSNQTHSSAVDTALSNDVIPSCHDLTNMVSTTSYVEADDCQSTHGQSVLSTSLGHSWMLSETACETLASLLGGSISYELAERGCSPLAHRCTLNVLVEGRQEDKPELTFRTRAPHAGSSCVSDEEAATLDADANTVDAPLPKLEAISETGRSQDTVPSEIVSPSREERAGSGAAEIVSMTPSAPPRIQLSRSVSDWDRTIRRPHSTSSLPSLSSGRRSSRYEVAGNAPTILVVDDEPVTRKLTAHLLSSLGCKAVTLPDGEDAIKLLTDANALSLLSEDQYGSIPTFDVIFMDIVMRRVGGLEATAQLLACGVKTPILAVTAQASPADIALYQKVGFSGVIPKPFSKSDLKKALLMYVEGFSDRSPSALMSPAASPKKGLPTDLPPPIPNSRSLPDGGSPIAF